MIDINELRFSAANSVRDLALLPSEVLELLDRLKAAEKERDNANAAAACVALQTIELEAKLEAAEKDVALKERVIDALGSELNTVANKRDALRAKIEQMEKRKPVASIYIDGKGEREFDDWKCDLPTGRSLLYALPGAQGEEK